jgi:ProP effector
MKNQPLHPHTAAINNKQKNQAKLARHHALAWLAETFPDAFDNSTCIRPFKLNIMQDILLHTEQAHHAGISKSKLREAVVLFTRRIDYLTCLKAREVRIDLNGNSTDVHVSADEAERASLKIRRRVEKTAKNARKDLQTQHTLKPMNIPVPEAQQPAFSADHLSQTATRTPSVTIKRKATRTFDPHAVARLKEKLGLAQKEEALSV